MRNIEKIAEVPELNQTMLGFYMNESESNVHFGMKIENEFLPIYCE